MSANLCDYLKALAEEKDQKKLQDLIDALRKRPEKFNTFSRRLLAVGDKC